MKITVSSSRACTGRRLPEWLPNAAIGSLGGEAERVDAKVVAGPILPRSHDTDPHLGHILIGRSVRNPHRPAGDVTRAVAE